MRQPRMDQTPRQMMSEFAPKAQEPDAPRPTEARSKPSQLTCGVQKLPLAFCDLPSRVDVFLNSFEFDEALPIREYGVI